jgi:hypothetical protein
MVLVSEHNSALREKGITFTRRGYLQLRSWEIDILFSYEYHITSLAYPISQFSPDLAPNEARLLSRYF